MSKITSKGQLTVPKRIREALGLKKGTDVEFILDGNRAFLQPVRGSRVASVAGALRGFAERAQSLSENRLMEKMREEVTDASASEGRVRRHKRTS